jgi:cytochrome c-type biogenesis protein
MLFNINPFKFLSFLSNLHVNSSGHLEGLILGLTLGVIWIPCVGPFLSAILFQVAAHGRIGFGIVAMLFYSIGFSIPMLGVAYASHFTRNRTDFIKRHPKMVSAINGILLIAFGLYITFVGMIGFSSF